MKHRSIFLGGILIMMLVACGSPVATTEPQEPTSIPPEPTSTSAPEPTSTTSLPSLPGREVIAITEMEQGIPWLPFDENKRPAVFYFALNIHSEPLDDPLVRQALAAALDRQRFAQMPRNVSIKQPATSLTPATILGRDLYNEVGVGFDPEHARELLAEAGYPNGEGFPKLTFYVHNIGQAPLENSLSYNVVLRATEMWQENLNIQVELQVVETEANYQAYFDSVMAGQPNFFEIYWVADYFDPDNFLTLFVSDGPYNLLGFASAEFDQLVEQAAGLTDPVERQALYIEAERVLTEKEIAVIPLFYTIK